MLLCFGSTCKSPAEIVNSLIMRAVSSRQHWKPLMSAFLLLSDNMSSGKFCPHSKIWSFLFFCQALLNVILPAQQFPPHSATHNSELYTHSHLFLHSNNFFVFLLGHRYFLLLSKSSLFIQPEAWGAPLRTTVQAPTTGYINDAQCKELPACCLLLAFITNNLHAGCQAIANTPI